MRLRALIASLAAVLAVGAPPAASGDAPEGPGPGVTLPQLAQAVGGRGASQAPWRYAYLEKLDGHLQAVVVSRVGAGGVESAQAAARRQGVTTSPQGGVLVDVYVNGDVARAADDLRVLGMRVIAVSERAPARAVEGFLPAEGLARAAALGSTHAILSTLSIAHTGSVLSQGDAAIRGPEARALGPIGTGVSVGIISDSIDHPAGGVAASQMTGDLPVVQNLGDDVLHGQDEGRAMAEIVYDEAPGISSIVFSSGTLGAGAAKAAAIDALVSHGVKVIADDIGILNEPFFQDGIVAQAVDRAKAAGVAYVTAAGNDSRNSWEGTYAPVPDPTLQSPTTEDFDPGATADTMQSIPVPANVPVTLVLQWAEPWGRATTDLDLDVYDITGGSPALLGSSETDNIATGIPLEGGFLPASGTARTLAVAIRRVSGSATPRMKYMAFVNGPPLSMEHSASSGAISPDAASANGALTVAASPYATPTAPEYFSSRGPVTRFFGANGNLLATPEVRQKPNLAAPDGVQTTLPGFANFRGTSAAAPAAAGIAALIFSAKPAMAIDVLYAIMTNAANALDCPAPGNPDLDCGAGFLLADRAVAMALDSTPPVITPNVSPATPDGPNGWYRVPVNVTWNVSDGESPVVDPAGCDGTSPGEGTTTLMCSATSAGGTISIPLTLKRDSTPPSAPAVTGIEAKPYLPAALPRVSSIACGASDPTSGVVGCAVSGYKTGPGAHTLTAVATNAAGLTATSTVTYTILRPAAISRLTLAKGLTLGKLTRAGIPVSVRVATDSTRLAVKLVARLPKASGTGTAAVTLASFAKRVSAGTAHVRITLTAKLKRQLRTPSKVALKLTISGTSARATATSLQRPFVLRRR